MPKTYKLAAKAAKIEVKPATHKGAVILALRKIGKGTVEEVRNEVERQGKIETDMPLASAVSWMLFDLRRKKLVVSR